MLFPKIWIICRVCLQQHHEMFNIFDKLVNKNIWEILRDCGGVPVRKNDEMPDKICQECLLKLSKAHNFRKDCQRSHRELVQMLVERNALMYTLSLEEENEYCSEYLTNSLFKLGQNMSNDFKENDENTAFSNCDNTTTRDNIKMHNIKSYCVASKNNDEHRKQEECTRSDQNEKCYNVTNEEEMATGGNIETIAKTLSKKGGRIYRNTEFKHKSNEKMKLKHKRSTKLICTFCNKTCKSYALLRQHLYIHKRPYECKICKKNFSQSKGFLSHINQHLGIKPYCCRSCFRPFADISNRNSHERKMHIVEEFKCNKCDKVFRYSHLLVKHLKIHRPKKCFICDKEFSSLQMARGHLERIHLNRIKFANKKKKE